VRAECLVGCHNPVDQYRRCQRQFTMYITLQETLSHGRRHSACSHSSMQCTRCESRNILSARIKMQHCSKRSVFPHVFAALRTSSAMAGLASFGQQPLHPVVGIQWMLGGQGAARWARDGKLDLRRHIPLTRNLGIEVCLCQVVCCCEAALLAVGPLETAWQLMLPCTGAVKLGAV
jgi:hypothetical protein